MKTLDKVLENNAVFVLELENEIEIKNFLHSIWIFTDTILVVLKNDNWPLLVEIDWAKFAISRKIAKEITTSHILEDQLKIFGWNQTEQRKIILSILKEKKNHFSLKEVVEESRKKDKKIGQITIYRCLKTLVKKWILEVIELPDGTKKFEKKKRHHDHLICENCGTIFEFYNEEIEKIQKEIAKKYWIELVSHTLNLIGKKCKRCR